MANKIKIIKGSVLNILEVCFSEGGGGLELYCLDVSKRLSERGHNVIPVCKSESFLSERFLVQNKKTITFHFKLIYLNLWIAIQISRIIKNNNISIIHLHRTKDLSIAILAKKLSKQSKIVITQQMESSRNKKDLFHNWIYSNTDYLIAITKRIKKQVERNTVMEAERTRVLYYGIDHNIYRKDPHNRKTYREKHQFHEDDVVIGIIGRLEEGKGQHILIQVIEQLVEQGLPVKLLIIGGETINQKGYTEYLYQLTKEKNLTDYVHFTGFINNVSAYSSCLDILVLATKKETFGLVLIEAMSQGIPVIGSNAGGVPEIISDGINGLLFEPNDVTSLYYQLKKLINDGHLRKALSNEGIKDSISRFSIEQHVAELEGIFGNVIYG